MAAAGERGMTLDVGPGDALRRSGIREIMDLAATLDDVVHLEVGEPDFPTPPHVVDAVQRAIADGNVKYTVSRGLASLRELIADKLRTRNSIEAGADRVVVTSGGMPGILETLLVLVRRGDTVLIPDPGWPAFELAASLTGAQVVPYPVVRERGYLPDLERLEALAAGARLLIVNSPSNPTGAVYDRATLESLYELARRHGLAVLSDEVYEDIVFDGDHISLSSLDEDGRVVSVFSFSKGFAMTGWRIGYVTGPSQFVETMVKVQEPVVACPSYVAQRAAEAALTGPQGLLAERREAYRVRRDSVLPLLREHRLFVSEPQGTFYVMADLSALGADTYATAKRLLLEQRVAVAPGETFGTSGAGLARLSLAGAETTVVEGVRRLGEAVSRAR
jgi:aspartate aminotransferase/aminotransferase